MSENLKKLTSMNGYLNKPKTFFGIPRDYAVISGFLMVISVISNHMVMGLIISAICIFALVLLKKGKGSAYLLVLIYWITPGYISRLIFRKTPTSDEKFWMN